MSHVKQSESATPDEPVTRDVSPPPRNPPGGRYEYLTQKGEWKTAERVSEQDGGWLHHHRDDGVPMLSRPKEWRIVSDWSFEASGAHGDRIDVFIRDDGAVAVAVVQSGALSGVALERSAVRRLRDCLTRLLAEPDSAHPEESERAP